MQVGQGKRLTDPDPFPTRPKRETALVFSALVASFVIVCVLAWDLSAFQSDLVRISASAVLAITLLTLSWIDLDRFLLPDVLTLPLIILGFAQAWLLERSMMESVLGAIAGYGIIAGLHHLWRLRFGRQGIGLGDAKLLAVCGSWVGVYNIPLTLLISSGLALIVVFVLAISGRKQATQTHLPFGPLLSLGIWMIWCLEPVLLS